MGESQSEFEELLYGHLVPEFCEVANRRCHADNFRRASVQVSEQDACDFLRAWGGGLLTHRGRGLYRAAASSASEQFFWEGPRKSDPRWFSLSLEPIITVAALARLHFDFDWPMDLLGTQSTNWAFDMIALHPESGGEVIAGEVKKARAEVDTLLDLMVDFGRRPSDTCPASGKQRNAFKKVAALRAGHSPVFWAVGPDRYSQAYRVEYTGDIIGFSQIDEAELRYGSLVSSEALVATP